MDASGADSPEPQRRPGRLADLEYADAPHTGARPDPCGPGPVVGVQNGTSASVIGGTSRPQRISVSVTPSGQWQVSMAMIS